MGRDTIISLHALGPPHQGKPLPTETVDCQAAFWLRRGSHWAPTWREAWSASDQHHRNKFVENRRECLCSGCRRWLQTGDDPRLRSEAAP